MRATLLQAWGGRSGPLVGPCGRLSSEVEVSGGSWEIRGGVWDTMGWQPVSTPAAVLGLAARGPLLAVVWTGVRACIGPIGRGPSAAYHLSGLFMACYGGAHS